MLQGLRRSLCGRLGDTDCIFYETKRRSAPEGGNRESLVCHAATRCSSVHARRQPGTDSPPLRPAAPIPDRRIALNLLPTRLPRPIGIDTVPCREASEEVSAAGALCGRHDVPTPTAKGGSSEPRDLRHGCRSSRKIRSPGRTKPWRIANGRRFWRRERGHSVRLCGQGGRETHRDRESSYFSSDVAFLITKTVGTATLYGWRDSHARTKVEASIRSTPTAQTVASKKESRAGGKNDAHGDVVEDGHWWLFAVLLRMHDEHRRRQGPSLVLRML